MKLITVRYLGFTAMDRRFSDAMLPWIVSEIRKRDSRDQVSLGAEDGTLQGYNADFELQFAHPIKDISRFSQADTDPCAFLYLVQDNTDRLLYCYMFQATQPNDVSELYQQMREQGASSTSGPTSLASLCGDISPSSSHFFEVLYVGKLRVSHRRVPETFIDDALDKFRSHEVARRDSTASSDSATAEPLLHAPPTTASQEEPTEAPHRKEHHDHNRTMVLQVGRGELRLISPDRKQVLLHRHHRDVVVCVQGARSPEHFGFVCREQHHSQAPPTPSPSQPPSQHPSHTSYVGYIFKCECASVASDAVGAVSQAASAPAASAARASPPAVTTCEHCPMVWFHRLCTDVDGLGDRKTQAMIFRRVEQLDDEEQASILTKFRGAETDSTRDQNEFLMMLLRAHCEMKQNRHVHDTAENRSEFLSHYLGGGTTTNGHSSTGTIFMKAKRSLSSSFEHLLKRKGSRDDIGAHLPRDLSLPVVGPVLTREGSPPTPTTPTTPSFDETGPRRARSATIGSHAEFTNTLSPERNAAGPKSPMMDIFMKVGNSPRSGSGGAADEASPRSAGSGAGSTPGGSWRQAIFNRVVTPSKGAAAAGARPDHAVDLHTAPATPRSPEQLRALWRRAIRQAVLLVRMEKENARLRARQEVSAVKRVKLEYDELCGSGRDLIPLWESLSIGSGDPRLLLAAVGRGIPAARRGEVWQRLAEMHSAAGPPPPDAARFPNYDVPYEQLLKQLTAHQHAILIDLGRTFPNHPYYRAPLGPGQLALFNLLKAYSLLDPEVGYCQGLSFVAGVLLLHMDEADAFAALRHLMFRRGLRAHYLPDMAALQVRLYQLSRLLHDRQPELYAHLDAHEVAPTLYAAPWLLTLFASQFPLGFVARVIDVLLVEGADVVFRVALALLAHHAEALLACDTFEQIMECLKCRLPDVDAPLLDKVMTKALAASSDVAGRLNEYRVEYQVLQEEANSAKPHLDELQRLRVENRALLERSSALAAQLEISLSNVQRLERNRTLQQSQMNRLEAQARALEVSVVTLGTWVDGLVERHVDVDIPGDVRRIVAQLMVHERRRTDTRPPAAQHLIRTISNSTQLFKREGQPPPGHMVKSLSTGRITTPTVEAPPRSVSLNTGSDLERELRSTPQSLLSLSADRGVPLRVIDDDASPTSPRPHPLKSTLSHPNLGAKVSHFFSNTHSHILRHQHRSPGSPPPSPPHQIIREESREDMSPTEESPTSDLINNTSGVEGSVQLSQVIGSDRDKCSLPLREDDLVTAERASPSDSIDSGVGTPATSPPGPDLGEAPPGVHPLSGCDVNFTFNGTTKLKNIRTIRNLSRNSSPDLLGK